MFAEHLHTKPSNGIALMETTCDVLL